MGDEELRREIAELRDRLERAERRLAATAPAAAAPTGGVTDRRSLLLKAGVAAGAVAAAGVAAASPATADDGQPLVLGQVNSATVTTQLNNNAVSTTPVLAVQDEDGAVLANEAVLYVRGTYYDTGIFAQCTGGPSGPAVRGRTTGGIGVQGEGLAGVGVKALGDRQLELVPQATPGAPTSGASQLGQVYVDQTGGFWCCVAAGSPGSWRRIAAPGSAGAFTAVDPTRVYDSRLPGGGGVLAGGQSRVVSVANGINPFTGAVTVANLVPAGATAIQYNVTIVNTVGSGYLQVAPGNAPAVTGSSINWTTSGTTLANGLSVKLDTGRQVKVFAAVGSTDLTLDVLGYYL